jgi:TatD DNase family protein
MKTGLIDSHCHLNHADISALGDPATLMRTAHDAGVVGALTINCQIATEFPDVLKVAQANRNVWCTVGTHPHDAGLPEEKSITLERLIEIANSDPKVIGIGESGLDYYYNHSSHADQQASFRKHIRACKATGLPLVVHARDADEDIIKIMKDEGAGVGSGLSGVMHCFSSTRWLAEQALELGFYISFSGILTFKKSQELRDIARDVPLDRLLVETDSPYLAPDPLRGKPNQPAYIIHTLRVLADIKNLDEQGAINLCSKNFFNLFSKARLEP